MEAVRYRLAAIAGLLRAAGQNGGWRDAAECRSARSYQYRLQQARGNFLMSRQPRARQLMDALSSAVGARTNGASSYHLTHRPVESSASSLASSSRSQGSAPECLPLLEGPT